MTVELIPLISISLFCCGLYQLFQYPNIGYPIGVFLEKLLPIIIYKPFIGCLPCMASVWTPVFISSWDVQLILNILIVSAINKILSSWLV